MLVAKHLFPLFCIVLHLTIMFSMVQASPMENLAGYGDPQWDPLDWPAQGMDITSSSHDLETPLVEDTGELSDIIKHVPNTAASSSHPILLGQPSLTEEDCSVLINFIKSLKPPGSKPKRVQTNGVSHNYYNLGDLTHQAILATLFKISLTPPPVVVQGKELNDIIPLFFTHDRTYFVARTDTYGFLICSRPFNAVNAEVYGTIKSGLSQRIHKWKMPL